MRLQLVPARLQRASVVLLVAAMASSAGADELVIRGNYWRDRNTRVVQPEADVSREIPSGTIVGAHYLLDTITSASVAAGASRDEPFTELRHEAGFRLGQRLGPATVTASYSYSSESDYWAHLLGVTGALDLFQKNSSVALALFYGNDSVAQRVGPTVYNPVGGLQSIRALASWTQVFSRTLLADVAYELAIQGFGSSKFSLTGAPNKDTGFQANPYRSVLVGGSPNREVTPFQRVRQSLTASLRFIVPFHHPVVHHLVLHPSYRLYWDDWGVAGHTPELRTSLAVGPTEIRVTGRYYAQSAASFWSIDKNLQPLDAPNYSLPGTTTGIPCYTCQLAESRNGKFYTSDPKLSAFESMLIEVRLLVNLHGARRLQWLPLHNWIGDGNFEISYGHYFNDRFAHTAYGDAEVAGLSFGFPL